MFYSAVLRGYGEEGISPGDHGWLGRDTGEAQQTPSGGGEGVALPHALPWQLRSNDWAKCLRQAPARPHFIAPVIQPQAPGVHATLARRCTGMTAI